MTSHRIAALRQWLDHQPAESTPAARRLRLRLRDALDRLAALFGPGVEPAASPTLARALRDAAAEYEAALAAAATCLDTAGRAAGQALADSLADDAAPRHGWFRAARAGPLAPLDAGPAGAPSPAAAAPIATADEVRFGASAPQTARAGRAFVARFVLYAQADEAQALARLGQAAGLQVESGLGGTALAHGTALDIAVSGDQLLVEGVPRCVQRLVWRGSIQRLDVEVQPAAGFTGSVLRFDILLDGLVLARIRLALEAAADAPAPGSAVRSSTGHALARKAFASYASADRQRVLDRVASVRLAAALQVFLDCHDLCPGQAWQPRLAQEIDGCDTFLLFWSDAAAASTWVRWEWERALARHGLEHLQFHPLDNGVAPPPELGALHANDPLMDLRQAHASRSAAQGGAHG